MLKYSGKLLEVDFKWRRGDEARFWERKKKDGTFGGRQRVTVMRVAPGLSYTLAQRPIPGLSAGITLLCYSWDLISCRERLARCPSYGRCSTVVALISITMAMHDDREAGHRDRKGRTRRHSVEQMSRLQGHRRAFARWGHGSRPQKSFRVTHAELSDFKYRGAWHDEDKSRDYSIMKTVCREVFYCIIKISWHCTGGCDLTG